MIVWIASYPRSGNTLFRMLLHHCWGLTTYSRYDDPDLERLGAGETVGHARLPAPVEELRAHDQTFFVKTHDQPDDTAPAIYLVRDGRDAVVSLARYQRQIARRSWRARLRDRFSGDPFGATLRKLIIEASPHGGWSGNVLAWTRRSAPTAVLKFEELIADPPKRAEAALGELGLGLQSPTGRLPSFESLHERWPAFFRKGRVGAWRQEMPGDLHRLFWEHHREAMQSLGYA